uniref:Fibrinogen C-terminal domain-containing protein n=1 Tax=Anopheles christyi TaxID=43041 RepID=A0A182K118_9DIPT
MESNLTALHIQSNTAMKKDREFIDQQMSHWENLAEGLLSIYQLSKTMERNFNVLQILHNIALDQISVDQKVLDQKTEPDYLLSVINRLSLNQEQMQKDIELPASKKDLDLFIINSGLNLRNISFESCTKNPSKRSGKYILQLTENDEPFWGYCEQTTFGGGWLVFQYRYEGLLNFYRNWTEYRNGFGSVDGEFWLGLERLHRLTLARPHELLVELKDFTGTYKYARYDEFVIGTEAEQYSLTKLGSYTGTAERRPKF